MPAYLGVQCYQCSGFQVIQEKKSSNKWACALCGEKQSVRKVRRIPIHLIISPPLPWSRMCGSMCRADG